MPRTTFKAKTKTKLNGNIVDTKIDFYSTLANLNVKSAKFDISNASLKSDYLATISKLDRLYFVTEQHMRGGIKVNGDVKKAKDLDFTAHSNIADGKMDVKLHNDDLHVDLNSVKTKKVLYMMMYPEIFLARLDAKVDYNLVKQKGKVEGYVKDGKFAKNEAFDIAREFAGIDMYRETFKGDVNADINKENILASLDLASRKASIKTKNTKLNTKANTINSTINVDANGNKLKVKLTGSLSAPKVHVDAGTLMKSQVGKMIDKKIGGDIGGLLKSFF